MENYGSALHLEEPAKKTIHKVLLTRVFAAFGAHCTWIQLWAFTEVAPEIAGTGKLNITLRNDWRCLTFIERLSLLLPFF